MRVWFIMRRTAIVIIGSGNETNVTLRPEDTCVENIMMNISSRFGRKKETKQEKPTQSGRELWTENPIKAPVRDSNRGSQRKKTGETPLS